MTFVLIDSDFDDLRVANLDPAMFLPCVGLHLLAMCWSARNRTAGRVTLSALASILPGHDVEPLAWELVRVGLWDATAWDFRIIDYREADSGDVIRAQARRMWRDFVHERDGSYCRHCGTTDNLTIDHVIPLSRGGSNDPDNLQVLCRSCNSSKGARL